MGGAGLVVQATGLRLHYGEVAALDGVDLAVHDGEVHGLAGANGAGKSTLLSVLLGLAVPDEGSVRLFGRTRDQAGPSWLDGVGGSVGAPAFYPYLSGRRNLAVLAALDGGRGGLPLGALLDLVGLSRAADRRVRGYSLGMRQRLALAAALLRRPRLLILDEPTNGLDPAGVRDLHAVVRRLAGSGVAVLLSCHDMTQLSELCDRVTVLHRAQVVFSGSVAQARSQAPDPSWRLTTSGDHAASQVAAGLPGLRVTPDARGGLRAVGGRARLDAYVLALGRAGVAVRSLAEDVTALEALFLSLTAAPARQPAAGTPVAVDRHVTDGHGADRQEADRQEADRQEADRHEADRHEADRHEADGHGAGR